MVAAHRTKQDWAQFIRRLADEHYPEADKIVLVMDNLNKHTLSALYEVFPVAKARRLCQRFEVHYPPKHASWLNMAEIELSVLDRQCLSQRLPSLEVASQQVAAWTSRRNQAEVTINWRFTAEHASIKLKHLYLSISDIYRKGYFHYVSSIIRVGVLPIPLFIAPMQPSEMVGRFLGPYAY
jgi:hypothetical protein